MNKENELRLKTASTILPAVMAAVANVGMPAGKDQYAYVADITIKFTDALIKHLETEEEIKASNERIKE